MRRAARHRYSVVSNEKGVTLVEVLVAALVLAFGLLGVAMMQYAAITGNAFGKEMQTATTLCQEVLEIIRATPVRQADGTALQIIVSPGNDHPTAADIDDTSAPPGSLSLAKPDKTNIARTGGVDFTRVWWVVDRCRRAVVNDPNPTIPVCNPQPAANCLPADALQNDGMRAVAVRTCWIDRNGGNHSVTLFGEKWDTSLIW